MQKIKINFQVFDDFLKTKKIVIGLDKNRFKFVMAIFLVFIIIFSGWQAFNGSFYPARGPDISTGNSVANIGAFTPLSVNQSVINAYNLIAMQNGSFRR